MDQRSVETGSGMNGGRAEVMARKVQQLQFDIRRESSGVSITDLNEIGGRLGTYRERMRLAGSKDRQELANDMRRWSDPSLRHGAELA